MTISFVSSSSKSSSLSTLKLSSKTILQVAHCWELLHTKIPNFDDVAGEKLFRRFFELDPTPGIFSFGRTVIDINDLSFYTSPGLKRHAKNVFTYLHQFITTIVLTITTNPNPSTSTSTSTNTSTNTETTHTTNTTTETTVLLSSIQEAIMELGQKHKLYGVTSRMYQPMGQALVTTIAELYESSYCDHQIFTSELLQSWIEVYHALATDLCNTTTTK